MKKNESTVERVVRAIKDDLRCGLYQAGQKYLSENELCKKYSVSRTTIREALRVIQVMGLLELKSGRGAFVCAIEEETDDERALNWISLRKAELLDLAEVRLGLEPLAAKYASRRANEDEICMLLGTLPLLEMACERDDAVGMMEADRKFHHFLAIASHNEVLIKLNDILDDRLFDCRASLFSIKDNGKAAISEHTAIAQAIACHDEEAAYEATVGHIEKAIQNIINLSMRCTHA